MAGLLSLRRLATSLSSSNILPLYSRKFSASHSSRETDSCGLPTQPTWSVNELLSSYPSPKLPATTIARLYELSALVCPEEDTPQFKLVKEELEDMIRLVEAVRKVDTSGISVKGRGEKEDADVHTFHPKQLGESGKTLLKHASRTQDGFYIVDAERKR